MNLNPSNLPIDEQIAVLATETLNARRSGRRIERCEFEELLQHAMEILNAGDLKFELKKTA